MRPLLRNWSAFKIPLPTGGVVLDGWHARRDHHSYLVTFDPLHPSRGFGASYKDARQERSSSRFIPDIETQHPDLVAAQAACEADLRRLLGRLH